MTERQGGSDVRANETTARPDGDAWVLDGHKWFCSAPMSDAFLVLAQAPAGLSCFLLERPQPGLPDRAAEGQARQPLERLGGDRARRRRREARRRGGSRPEDDPRDGQPHAARLRARLGRADAPRRRGGDAPCRAPRRLRPAAGRAAADAERARRPLRRERGGDRDGAAAGASLRRGGRPVPPAGDRGREVLGLQADAAARRGGARVPRRQRLRRGVAAAAALPREPAQLDLGGLRERQRARRPACARPRARDGRGVPRRGAARRRDGRAARRRDRHGSSASSPSRRSRAPAGCSSCSRSRSRARCSSATVRPRSPTPSARGSSGRAASTGRFPPPSTTPRSSRVPGRACPGRLRTWPSRSSTAPSEAATTAGPRVSRPS